MRLVGINKVHERAHELYYKITQTDVEWVLEKYTYYKQQEANKTSLLLNQLSASVALIESI
jgi:hypothetical protein